MNNPTGLSPEVLAPIRLVFFQECEEQLAEMESGLLALQRGERDPELINSVFRAAHSIKGGAGIFGFDALVRFAHLFETAMDEVRSGSVPLHEGPLKTLLRAADLLADHVRAARDEGPAPDSEAVEAALALLIGEHPDDADEEFLLGADFQPTPAVFTPLTSSAAPEPAEDVWDGFMPSPEAPPAPAAAAAEPAPISTSLRVDLDRVDRLIDLAGELVITQAMLAERAAGVGLTAECEFGLALDDLHQLTRDLQDSIMAMRAQSVKPVFQRMSRLVRELEASTGKSVELTVTGEATEVDRTVIERLTDPLTHMIRNAVDHGLESPEQRRAAGKSARGSLRLSAAHRAGRIVIQVADDGAGVDRARVRSIAVERGLIAPDARLSDDEADNLIFLPGFSTARSVSDLSGRGVGLDVVKRGVQSLGGRIALSSRPGEGSTFTLSLPLTLAVQDGMLVRVAGQNLVAPLTALVESVQPHPADVRRLGPNASLLAYRGEQVPLIDLGVALGFRDAFSLEPHSVALLVEDDTGRRIALLVDEILDQRQVVIKSLEANYRRVEGIAAATILGDGRVALILDIDTVIACQGRPTPGSERLAATG